MQNWSVATIEADGDTGEARLRGGLSLEGRPNFLHVQVVYQDLNEDDGMPTPEEQAALEGVEREIEAWGERTLGAVLFAVITWPAARDYLFYAERPLEPGAHALELQLAAGDRELNIAQEPDPDGDVYRRFVAPL